MGIWWNNGDKGCDMARVKTWWKPYLTLLLGGYFSLLNFEDFEEYLGSILFLFLFSLTRTQTSFASTYQEINNKDCWSNLNDNDKV
jgi:hypothetical protein